MKRKYLSVLFALTATIFAITGCGSDSEPSTTNKTEKPSVEISESIDSTESDVSENVSESETVTEEPTTEEFVLDTSRSNLERIAGLKATCETDINACYVDITSENPYDVVWDYGEEYEKYVAACDWSLVWDYDFYVKTYPGLAALYHYDEALLLRHFQTVGIHEGRIGCEDVYVKFNHGSSPDQIAYWYFDFMFNYDEYAADVENGYYHISKTNEPKLQSYNVMTALEKEKLNAVNKYRYDIIQVTHDIYLRNDMYTNDELTCFANLRAYLSVHDNYVGDDWFNENKLAYMASAFPYQNISDTTAVAMSYFDYDGKLTLDSIMTNINPESEEYSKYINNNSFASMGISNVYYNPDTDKSCHIDVYSEFHSLLMTLYTDYRLE